ncbi:MAG TPA: CDGSH iron-sulfur domain-containing protein [Actinomycetota bacterium]|jgi:CDGSH-type Zn-finger protein|nr:CDGSH iron-sulfur domain-containing protein [Actinomycetota bacterium]
MAASDDMRITVTENGPYRVTGSVPLVPRTIVTDDEGFSVEWGEGEPYATEATYDLCRCGESKTAPFCDKACESNGFDGTETASRKPYLEQAEEEVGHDLILTDAEDLCAYGRFCDPGGQIWNLVQEHDDASKALAIREGKLCPSGRLVTWDKETRTRNEEDYEPSIGVVQDPSEGCSGPLAVRGGIPVIGADGFEYEVRNRQTLCRCGQSENKPLCNGSHAAVKFQDGQAERGALST